MWPSALLYWKIGLYDPNVPLNYSSPTSHLDRDDHSHLLRLVFDWFPYLQSPNPWVWHLRPSSFYPLLTFPILFLFLVFHVNWMACSFSSKSCRLMLHPSTLASEAILNPDSPFFHFYCQHRIQCTGQISVLNIVEYNLYFLWGLDLHNPGGETST